MTGTPYRQRALLLRRPAGRSRERDAWGFGAIGVANWRGVRLAAVLDRLPSAVDVMPQGLDADDVTGDLDYGHVRRPMPVSKASENVILAYEMNGQPLYAAGHAALTLRRTPDSSGLTFADIGI